MKRFSRGLLLVVIFVMPSFSWAQQCYNTAHPAGTVVNFNPLVFYIPAFDTGVFNPNVPDNTVLARKVVKMPNPLGDFWISCHGTPSNVPAEIGPTAWEGTGAYGGSTAGRGLYSTGIPGIWFRFSFPEASPSSYIPVGAFFPSYVTVPSPSMAFFSGLVLQVELVKKGQITERGVITGEVGGYFRWQFGRGQQLISIRIGGSIVVEPQVPTCRVTTPTITVPLGNMPASTFTGVGTPSPSRPFNIALQCSDIEAGKSLNVYTTLTDHTNPSNVSDTLSLAADSTATGIGIQVLNGSTVIKYGPDSSAVGNTNQWKAGEAGNGTFTIPLTARYIQTAPKVTPGTANGLATFTMSYQ